MVKFYKLDKGWGAITTDELAEGSDVFVHSSAIDAPGYRSLEAGDVVEFDYEEAEQDSFRYRATRVRWLSAGAPPAPPDTRLRRRRGPGGAGARDTGP